MKKLNLTPEERKNRILEQKRQEYQRNKEKYKKSFKEYRLKNREKLLKQQKQYWLKNKDKFNEKKRQKYQIIKDNPEFRKKEKENAKKTYRRKRLKIIEYYSKGNNCCDICGESDFDVLIVDHINGGGNQHRKKVKGHFINDLIKNNYPEGYRILCQNCNIKEAKRKGYYGTKQFIS